MELVFQDTLTSSHTSCLAVARFAAPVLLTQVRVTSHGAHDRPLQLLVHSMPSSSKPYAHFKSFTLSLAASPEPTQVFDLPVSPEHTMPARLLIFRGPWNGVHVEAYGFIQKKRPRPGPSSSSAVEPKRVKMEEPTPEPSTSQEVTAAVTPMKVPDWDEIHSLLQAHRTSKTQRHRSRDVDPETMKAARHAWKQTISNGDTEFQDLLANCRRLNANIPRPIQDALIAILQSKPSQKGLNLDIDLLSDYLASDAPLEYRRVIHRCMLDIIHMKPLIQPLATEILSFEQDQHVQLLAELSQRHRIQAAAEEEQGVDVNTWLEILEDEPAQWPFVLQQNPFDAVQDEDARTQATFWNLVLRSRIALSASIDYLLENAADNVTSLLPTPNRPELLDFLHCSALQTSSAFLDLEGLSDLQRRLVVAAVALQAKHTDEGYFWTSLQDEATLVLMHLLTDPQDRISLPGLNPWQLTNDPFTHLASFIKGRSLTAQDTSALLGGLRIADGVDAELRWAQTYPLGPPLFFAVLQLTDHWLQELEVCSNTLDLKDKDGLSLGCMASESQRSELLWIQLAALATLDRLLPSSQEAITHMLCLTFRLILAVDGIDENVTLIRAISTSVLKSLTSQLDGDHILPVMQRILASIKRRNSFTAAQPFNDVISSFENFELAGEKLLPLAPQLAHLVSDPLIGVQGAIQVGEHLEELSPQLHQTVIHHLIGQLEAAVQDDPHSEILGLNPLLGLSALKTIDKMPSLLKESLNKHKQLQDLLESKLVTVSDQSWLPILQLVARPLRKTDREQSFVIKRYQGQEAFRNRPSQSDGMANVRPPSLHVDAFKQK